MNPTPDQLRDWDRAHVWHPFTQMREWFSEDPLIIERAEGNHLIDVAGRRYFDGVSSLWCNVHGHGHPAITAAVTAQLGRVAHTTLLGLASVPSIALARRLTAIAPPGLTRVFFSDDGSTAVEAALKMAFQYWQMKGQTGRTRFASLADAYHGDTQGAMGVGYSETFHRFYGPLVREAVRLTPPHVFRFIERMPESAALEAAAGEARRKLTEHRAGLAALIVEPLVQGAAGIWTQPAGYLRALRQITRELDILLIADEVATGFGRTGTMFACEQEDVGPDLFCAAKGLTGGVLPLAATLATEEIFSAFLGRHEEYRAFLHGHTYTGNPLACAAALASLDVFETEGVLMRLKPKIGRLRDGLQGAIAPLPSVADIRQCGFMAGIELMRDPERRIGYDPAERIGLRVVRAARARGVILRPLGNVIVLMPPLSTTEAELDLLVDATRDAIAAAARESMGPPA